MRPDSPVSVWASNGRLTDVVVQGPSGRVLGGATAGRGMVWRSSDPLDFGSTYRVQARAVGVGGDNVEQTVTFSTLKPEDIAEYDIAPMPHETVGVGMPIIVYFDRPVKQKAAVEERLQVTASRPVQGAWHWFTDEELHFRPQRFWPSGTRVTVNAALRGVPIRNGVWGGRNLSVDFRIGPAMISKVNLDRHTLKVYRNGRHLRTIPVTGGKSGWETRSGTKVIMEKARYKTMDGSTVGASYNIDVEYAMRVTWSGEFLHAAPWSVGSQGTDNVSHGCVGMSTGNAAWYFNHSNRGDVVRVSGTNRSIEKGNGFTDWEMSWAQYQKGSALS